MSYGLSPASVGIAEVGMNPFYQRFFSSETIKSNSAE